MIHPAMAYQKTQLQLLLLIWFSVICLISSLPNEDQFSILNQPGSSGPPIISEERTVELFRLWKEKHGKVYKHAVEAEKRFETFKNNLKYVMEKNSVKNGGDSRLMHKVGLNKFADLSNEEYREIYLSKVKKPMKKTEMMIERRRGMKEQKRRLGSCDAPSSLDWRKYGIVTGVKDQGQCGSCWSFSSTGAIEGINALVTGDLVSLSEQELVDCDSTNDGCDGGYMDYAFEWVISNGGIDSESDYPYTGTDGTCNTTKEDTKVVSIDGYTDVAEEESALLCAVAGQPVSVGIDASGFDFQLYTGGIYDGDCSDNPDNIDHAVLIVGYGSEGDEQYWIVKNSWGTSWGIDGYIYIRRNTSETYGVCAINAMASYPTKDSSSSPSPFPSPAVPPPPPPPPPSTPPPPPPSPSPSQCGDFSYCTTDETCCCLFEFFDYCFIYGCCGYENAVCCSGTEYCCPSDYPICDTDDLLCLKNSGDYLGVATKKRKMAKHKLPWTPKHEVKKEDYRPLQWKRNPFAAA